MSDALPPDLLDRMDAWWRAANYLSIGQIYLLENPLLREPLRIEHVKPRLLGHWGTTPGLNFVYVHLNRAIRERDLDALYITGPGHGGPGLVANTWLEGSYSELYPEISRDEEGMRRLFRQFSFPGGIPSHCAPETPGSIHEGGELGYSLAHAFGAVLDNPGLLAAYVVGDGEAETGPLAASWHSNKFLNPARDGAVLPILHLNGWKIANPTLLARMSDEELEQLFRGDDFRPFDLERDYRRYVDGKPRLDGVRDFLASREIALPENPSSEGADGSSIAALARRKDVLFGETLQKEGVEPYPDTIRWIEHARGEGLRLAIVSASHHCQEVLRTAGLETLFEVRVDGQVADALHLRGKPAPDVFLEGTRMLGVPPDRAIVVEDALAGVEAGRGGGFAWVVGVGRHDNAVELSAAGAHIVVHDLGQLVP